MKRKTIGFNSEINIKDNNKFAQHKTDSSPHLIKNIIISDSVSPCNSSC